MTVTVTKQNTYGRHFFAALAGYRMELQLTHGKATGTLFGVTLAGALVFARDGNGEPVHIPLADIKNVRLELAR